MTGAFGGLYLRGCWRADGGRDGHERLRGHELTLAYDGNVVTREPVRRRSRTAASRRSWGPTRAASRRSCARSRGCSSRARARCCSTARRSGRGRRARSPSSSACSRRARPRPTASRSPTSSPAGAIRTRACSGHGRRRMRAPCARRWRRPTSWRSPTGRWTSSRAASASASGSRWRSRRRRRCCCSTSRRRSSTSRTSSRCSTSARELHERGRTLVAVLHDLNHACRYATQLIAMRDGAIAAQGPAGGDRRRGAGRGGLRAALLGRAVPGDGRADGGARRAARAADRAAAAPRRRSTAPPRPTTAAGPWTDGAAAPDGGSAAAGTAPVSPRRGSSRPSAASSPSP